MSETISPENASARAGIDKGRLGDLLTGKADATAAELLSFCAGVNISPLWMLTGAGLPRVLSRNGEVDYQYYVPGRSEANRVDDQKLEELIAILLSPLNSSQRFWAHMVDSDAMSPRFRRGDIVIAEASLSKASSYAGTFLVEDREHEFPCFLVQDGSRFILSFENSKIASVIREGDPEMGAKFPGSFWIKGPITFHISMSRL